MSNLQSFGKKTLGNGEIDSYLGTSGVCRYNDSPALNGKPERFQYGHLP